MQKRKTLCLLLFFLGMGTAAFAQSEKEVSYGRNIIRVSPFSVTEAGLGGGVMYEHIFGKEGKVGVSVPILFGMPPFGGNEKWGLGWYFLPGLKIYPSGQRRVTYAIGPSWMFVSMPKLQQQPNFYSDNDRFLFGMIVNNYLNIQASDQLNVGIELGLGTVYPEVRMTALFLFTFGYRF